MSKMIFCQNASQVTTMHSKHIAAACKSFIGAKMMQFFILLLFLLPTFLRPNPGFEKSSLLSLRINKKGSEKKARMKLYLSYKPLLQAENIAISK